MRAVTPSSGRRVRALAGLSLLEVVVALGLLAVGALAILGLYANNLRTVKQAKDQIVLALLMRDLRAKTQLAAYTARSAAATGSAFAESNWLLRDPRAPDDAGTPLLLDGGGAGGSSDQQALNGQAWPAVKARYDLLSPAGGRWDQQPLCAGWQFRMRTALPAEAESNQLVDWDGYDVWDQSRRELLPNIHSDEIDGDGTPPRVPRTPVQPPERARATPPLGTVSTGYFGPPRPSHGVAFDPRGLRSHLKRIKCVIGWDLNDANNVFSGQHHTFYFTVYNPDLRKR